MSPSVDLSPATFMRLQAHAVPLVDTIESVINRLLDAQETKKGTPVPGHEQASDDVRRFNADIPPDLTHTKVLAVEFDGKALERGEAHWNGLLNAAVRKAKSKAGSAADLQRLLVVNFVQGPKTDEGYRFLSDVGLSVQGQDANGAWRAARRVAQQLRCSLNVTFIWRAKEEAAFPGQTGLLAIAR